MLKNYIYILKKLYVKSFIHYFALIDFFIGCMYFLGEETFFVGEKHKLGVKGCGGNWGIFNWFAWFSSVNSGILSSKSGNESFRA